VALPLASWVGFDGPRTQVLKVETASMAGFTASASWNDSVISSANPWDAALRYAGEFSGIRVAGGVGYADDDLGATRVSGSASIMHVGTGLFATGQAGRVDGGAKVYGATAGIERNFFGIGATTVFGEWSRGDDVTVSISPLGFAAGPIGRIDVYGLGVVQSINNSALDLYLGYRRVDVGMTDDIDIVMAGARVKF